MRRVGMRILVAIVLLPAVASAAPYDKMFEVGTTMTYDETSSRTWGGAKPTTTTTRATCRVTAVRTIAGATVSTIECDTKSEIAGFWMSTKRGLWHLLGDTADDVKETRRLAPMIAARPRVGSRERLDEFELGERFAVTKTKGRWCSTYEYSDPGGGTRSVACFENGSLVERTSEGFYWSEGGGESTSKSVLVPHSTPKPTPLEKTSP